MNEYHYDAKGRLVDKNGKPVKHNVMRDGEAISVSVMFTDSAMPPTGTSDAAQAVVAADYEAFLRGETPEAETVTHHDAADSGDYERWLHNDSDTSNDTTQGDTPRKVSDTQPAAEYDAWQRGEAA